MLRRLRRSFGSSRGMVLFSLLAVTCCSCAAGPQSPVTLSVDQSSAGQLIPDDFSGVSYETKMLLNSHGQHYFSPDNRRLISMFYALGIKNLRVGGNSADTPTVPYPLPSDIDDLFSVAKIADLKVIYNLRLRGQTDPTIDVGIAHFIMERYSENLLYFTIGNEPNVYLKKYPEYRAMLVKFITAIHAVEPNALFCGPSSTPSHVAWANNLANDMGDYPYFKFITQHSYPGGSAWTVKSPAVGRDEMLSEDWVNGYQKFYDTFVPTVEKRGLVYRLEEANSFFHGGLKDASNTMASALWGLDFMHWWAAHGCEGINFHTGDNVASGDRQTPAQYAVFVSAPNGYDVRPLGYAMKAFDLGGHGRSFPVEIDSPDKLNLTAYAVAPDGRNLFITIINKEHVSPVQTGDSHGTPARDASVTIASGGPYRHAEVQFLSEHGSHGDVSATTGVTLGGATFGQDATWNGTWTSLGERDWPNNFTVDVPAATAAVVHLSRD
jgi:hypothetical protein